MSHSRLPALFAAVLLGAAAGCKPPENPAFRAVRLAMEAEAGPAAHPRVSFLRDSTHLVVQLDSATFATMSDTAFADRARSLAGRALASYPQAAVLDSVTIGTVAPFEQERFVAVRVIRSRTFAAAALRGS